MIVFDVRSADEFAVSHLPGATRVSYDAAPDLFVSSIARRARSAHVVFYCTLGARSAGFAINVIDGLRQVGVRNVYTMSNGIIGWSNARLPWVDHKGPTQFVHPYDLGTSKALIRPHLARFDAR